MKGDHRHLVCKISLLRLVGFFLPAAWIINNTVSAVPSYPKSSLKRDYGRRDELPPRGRPAAEYAPRVAPERRPSYREDYSSRGSGYSDLPRATSRTATRRPYVDEGYGQRFERPPPSYREGRGRDYDTISGSKRPYSSMVSAYLDNLFILS